MLILIQIIPPSWSTWTLWNTG